jgi:hypothetical protein
VSWWNKKREEDDSFDNESDGPTPVYVPMSMIVRSVIYDAGFSDPEAVVASLGLQSVSDEVAEMEQDASERRLDAIEPLAPLLGVISAMLAKATVAYSISEMTEDEVSPEMQENLTNQFQRLALGSAICAVSTLIEIGLVKMNGEAIGIGPAPTDMNPEDLFGGSL